jgi:hypothetical protein
MAEPRDKDKQYFQVLEGTDPDTGVKRPYFQVHSTDNTRFISRKEANAIRDVYLKYGAAPQGYAVLPAPATARNLFETAVAEPLRAGAQVVRSSPDMPEIPLGTPMGEAGQEMLAPVTKGIPEIANFLKNTVIPGAMEQATTPRGAGALLGSTATALATGGASTLPAMGYQFLGTTLGAAMMDRLLNGKADIGKAFAEGLLAAGDRGFLGLVQWATGRGMPERVLQDTTGKIMDVLRKDQPQLAGKRELVPITMADNPKMLQRAVQMTIKDMRENVGSAVTDLTDAVKAALPGPLKPADSKVYETGVRTLQKRFGEYIDAVNDPVAFKTATDAIEKTYNTIGQVLRDAHPNDPAFQMAVESALDSFNTRMLQQAGAAHVVRAAEKSGMQGGWSNKRFMDEVQDYFRSNPESALEQAGEIASTGMYRNQIPSVRIPIPLTSGIRTPAMGRVYQSKSANITPELVPGQVGGTMALRSFTGAAPDVER